MMTHTPRYRRSGSQPAAKPATLWERLPYAVQLGVTVVLSATAFGLGYALVSTVQDAALG